jgi:hypothetical protein
MYFMKGIIQTVTLVPIPSGTDMCINRTFVAMITELGNCADMMFSGHTALAYIMVPKKIRWVVVPFVAVLLLLAKMHYLSDILVAVLVAQWIEFQIPLPSEQNERIVLEQVAGSKKKKDNPQQATKDQPAANKRLLENN